MTEIILALIATGLAGLLVAALTAYRRLHQEFQRRAAENARNLNAKNAVIRDLDSRREALDRSLRASEEWNRILKATMQDMLIVHRITPDGLPGLIVEVNEITCRTLGRTRETLLNLTPFDIEVSYTTAGPPGLKATEIAAMSETAVLKRVQALTLRDSRLVMKEVLEKKQAVFEREYETRNGKKIPVRVLARLLELPEETLVVCTAQDITAEREAQRAVRESEQRFHEFFEHSPVGVARYDSERKLVNVNQACLKMLGVPDPHAFAGCDLFQGEFVPAETRTTLTRGETTRYEARIDFDDIRRKNLFITSGTGTVFLDILVTNLGLDRYYQPRGYLVLVQDITKRREVEAALRQSERQLAQAQKMQALGTLAGGIAHDFNNILTPILGYAEMLRDSLPPQEEAHEYVQEILKAANRARDLVGQILTFSRRRPHASEYPPIRITPIIKEVAKLQAATLPQNIRIEVSIQTEHDSVAADPTEIHQVLMNLVTNAIYAMRDTGGALELKLTDFTIARKGRGEFPQLEPGRYLHLSVKDSGTGMDAATLEHLFEPFFTTKRGEGTGMGLAVVHGIVTSLKGTISVESAPGKGSTFHVILPAAEAEVFATSEGTAHIPAGTERILFVDDDVEINRMAAPLLRSLGYRPTCVMSGVEALELLRRNPDAFDLVITDIVMPELSGDRLAAEIHRLKPRLPILLCTGFSDVMMTDRISELGVQGILRKPLLRRELAQMIRAALGRQH